MLIGTGEIRDWLGLKEGDRESNAKLLSAAQMIQDFVEGYTNRKLEAARYNSDPSFTYMDGTGAPWIYLPQYPISYVYDVRVDSDREFGSGSVIASADFFWYPESGKLMSEGGYFTYGRRNVKVDYIAGYAPIVGGTWNSSVSTYPLPYDLRQVMIEMATATIKEGITAVHTVAAPGTEQPRFVQMLSVNSFWRNVLDGYKKYMGGLSYRDE